KINFIYNICSAYQRAIVIPVRNQWGINALGLPCLFAFLLQFAWAAFTRDTGMYVWLGFWTLCYLKRRGEAGRIRGQVNSYYDGWCINLGSNERLGKRFLEPALVGVFGAFLRWMYLENGWSPTGLPTFLLIGCVTLPFVASVNQMIHERKLDAIRDAEMEGQL